MTAAAAATTTRWRNFDALRLLAATAVVLSHCFLLSSNGYAQEPFVRLLGYHHDLGFIAVGAFFTISGFLVTRSFVGRASTVSFIVNRAARIFPGLILCTLVTALVLGPWFAPDALAFVTAPGTWSFIARTTLLQRDAGIDFPVALYSGDQGRALLGTTWSIQSEVQCYVIVALLGTIGALRIPAAVVLLAVGLWSYNQPDAIVLEALAATLMFFAAGMILWFVHERARPGAGVLAAAVAGLAVCLVVGRPMEGFALFGSVLLIQLATSERVRLPELGRHGDLSYGVYLYGFPVQQLVRATWGSGITWWRLFALSMPLALAVAWLSWHFLEERALAWAQRYRRTVGAAGQSAVAAPAALAAAPPS